jgi:hypothetical protein
MVNFRHAAIILELLLIGAGFSACSPGYQNTPPVIGPKDTAESSLGERFFREPRFSKYFVDHSAGNPNAVLAQGDPTLNLLPTPRRGTLTGPFAGQAMSCVACHMVGDAKNINHAGQRGYTDFSARSAIPPLPTDHLTTTTRNTPTLIDAFVNIGSPTFLLHFDGEFASIEDLIVGSWSGRNFGWLPGEESQAMANLVKIVKEDDGNNDLARNFGAASYRELLLGQDPAITHETRISSDYQIDVSQASDDQIVAAVVALVKNYLQALQFSVDVNGLNNGSPYDHFLIANKLPRAAKEGESDQDYGGRLSYLIQGLANPSYIDDDSGTFGETELTGLKIFLARSTVPTAQGAGFSQVGNCIACHAPPHFTDFKFHNTGESQDEYDSLHGPGAFMAMEVPSYAQRISNPVSVLPATDAHPSATGSFRTPPAADHPEYADLGAWNILNNDDYAHPQAALTAIFCPSGTCATDADRDTALKAALGAFKTPGIRETGLTDPYLHTGRKPTVQSVLQFYQQTSAMARAGLLRNGDPELLKIQIGADAVKSLTAFLNSLNEDYE